ncbi:MAG: HD domain-containing protein [Candidatus Saccharimonadales bacterium]
MEKGRIIFSEVEKLYSTASTSMGKWMWNNHTQWVANKAVELAEKYGADSEMAYCAALLHDLGDSRYERGHADFETWSWEESKAILKKAGFRHAEREEILEAVRTHSCHPGHLPTAQEGKVLATADAIWHLQTNFFPVICYMNRPDNTKTYEEWQGWFRQKIERDFGVKIFFDDEREEIREDYEALVRVFGNKALDDMTK